jgi:lipopolysaccharide export system permease protein
MRILTRYLLQQLAVPFVFSFTALTGFLLLQQVSRRIDMLLGKGLPVWVIVEFFLLTLPYLVAMTLSMSVLVAVLYAFSRMMDDREITAFRAGGISLSQLVRPTLLAAGGVAILSFLFSDQVLPRTNHRLRTLMSDIYRTKPTFSLKEHVINEVQRGRYALRAARIDQSSYRMLDVTLYDLSEQDRTRVIYADSGFIAFAANQEDLLLTLYDGEIHEFDRDEPRMFQHTEYVQQVVLMRGIGSEFMRREGDDYRGDREMGTCDLRTVVEEARREVWLAERQGFTARVNILRDIVGLDPVAPDTALPPPSKSLYCRGLEALSGVFGVRDLEAQTPDSLLRPLRRAVGPTSRRSQAQATIRGARSSEVRGFEDRARSARIRASVYAVELHKKYAIAVACLVFVLAGVPVALRFPKGGVGLVVGASMVIFAIYYVGLIAGESLANRLVVHPVVAMWSSNLVMAVLGALGLWRTRIAGTVPRSLARRRSSGSPS